MRVLITGGTGFVGRHFARRLLKEGHEITVVDIMAPAVAYGVTFLHQDIRTFMWANREVRWDLIIHCAAIVGGRLKIDGDPLAVATDLSIDSEFFNWAVRAKNRPKIIYFSSSAVYPLQLQTRECYISLSEQLVDPPNQMKLGKPDMTYGWAKLSGEVLAQYAVSHYNADIAIYRPFGGYGEDQSFDYPFPSIIRRIVNGENPVTVWGSGDQQRDFIHIEDIVDAVLATMHKLKPGETLNLGTGMGISFRELARIAADELNIPIDIVNDSTKPEGVFSRVADVYKLSELWDIPDPMPRLKWGIKKVAEALAGTKSP